MSESFIVDRTDFRRFIGVLRFGMATTTYQVQKIEKSDDELMEGVLNRKDEALECIYARYESLLRTVILSVIHDESEVDDILHEVLLQVWDQAEKYDPSDRGLRGLLVTLARRRALDKLRRRAAYRRATENLKGDIENPLINEVITTDADLENSDLSSLLKSLIRLLPPAQKEVIDLTFFNGMSQREIVAQRNIALGTVKTRLHLALRKLHSFLLPLQSKI